jgi:carbohydrate kinase (thermoresistant glucokinase family)
MARAPDCLVVVMGVAGSGKSTVGRLLAQRLGVEFLEGDELHPPRNVERMAAGIALTDADRRDWLVEIARQLADARAGHHGLVVSCSALKRSYRDTLRAASSDLAFVHLHGSTELLESRMRARADHFMPVSLLTSQLQTLEPPAAATERAVTFDAALPAAQLAERAAAWLAQLPPAPKGKGKR